MWLKWCHLYLPLGRYFCLSFMKCVVSTCRDPAKHLVKTFARIFNDFKLKTLYEKYPNTGFFLVRMWTLFRQWRFHQRCLRSCIHFWTLTHYSLVLLFYTPWKHQKTRSIRFSDIFRVYRKAATCCNGLIKCLTIHLQRDQFFGHQICKHQNITSTLIFLRVLGRNCYCSLIYLFHWNFVDLLFFLFLQGKMYSPKKSGSPQRFCASEQFVQAWFGKWCAKNYEL